MKLILHRFWWSGCLALCSLAVPIAVHAQVRGDGSLGTLVNGSPLAACGSGNCDITGGVVQGENLFHSFAEFSLPTGTSAYFDNGATIRNIITRVTGGNASQIDGILEANGNPTLFLLNPSGIVLGPNATLINIGSLVATTAHRLNFADGTSFDVDAPNPLLTVSIPTSLQFLSATPGIQVSSAGLFTSGGTLALVGGPITFQPGALLFVEPGRIELGSVAGPGKVQLNQANGLWNLSYGGVNQFGEIRVLQDATALAFGAGSSIQVQGGRVILQDGGSFQVATTGTAPSGDLVINAAESLELLGVSPTGTNPSGLLTTTFSNGAAGNIQVTTERLIAEGGGQIVAETASGIDPVSGAAISSTGKGGSIKITAFQSIDLMGESADTFFPTGIAAQSQGTGSGGEINIQTNHLRIHDGAYIATTTFGSQPAGNLSVKASTIELSGTSQNPIFITGLASSTEGAGAGGQLIIDTDRLTIENGALISVSTRGSGHAGKAKVQANEEITIVGTSPARTGIFAEVLGTASGQGGEIEVITSRLTVQRNGQISTTTQGRGPGGNLSIKAGQFTLRGGGQVIAITTGSSPAGQLTIASNTIHIDGMGQLPSGLFTQTQGSGNAGNLNITTDRLDVSNGAKISVSGEATGNAGNLRIVAQDLRLFDNGIITGETRSGQGGNLTLTADRIQLFNNSFISTSAGTFDLPGDGGNITIAADTLVGLQNSDITANAFLGRGGRIEITAQGIFGLSVRSQLTSASDITAFSRTNPALNGEIAIRTPDLDPSRGLAQFPTDVVNPGQVVATCPSGRPLQARDLRLTRTGRGLPPTPNDALSATEAVVGLADGVPFHTTEMGTTETTLTPSPIPQLMAQGWVVNAQGQLILTPTPTQGLPPLPLLLGASCL